MPFCPRSQRTYGSDQASILKQTTRGCMAPNRGDAAQRRYGGTTERFQECEGCLWQGAEEHDARLHQHTCHDAPPHAELHEHGAGYTAAERITAIQKALKGLLKPMISRWCCD